MTGLLASMAPNVLGMLGGLWQQGREQNWSANQAQINRDFQAAQAAQLNEWNRENWRMQNEYNSPDSMLQRYRAAGIGDAQALQMMGQGSTEAGQIQSSVAAQGSQATAPGSAVNAVSNSLNSAAVNAANIRSVMADAKGKEIDNEYKPIKNQKDIELLENTILKTYGEYEKNSEEANQIRQMLPLTKAMTRGQLSAVYLGITTASHELQNIIREGNILDIEAINKLIEQGVLKADILDKLTHAGLNIETAATQDSVRQSNYASAAESQSRIPVNNAQAIEIWTEVIKGCLEVKWQQAGFNPGAKGISGWVNYFMSKKNLENGNSLDGEGADNVFSPTQLDKLLNFAGDVVETAVAQSQLPGGFLNPSLAFPNAGQHGAAVQPGQPFHIPEWNFDPYGNGYTPWTFNPIFGK